MVKRYILQDLLRRQISSGYVQYSHSPGASQIMSRSTFIQGMAGDPLSLPVEYQDLVMKINSDHEEEVVKITEDTETKGDSGTNPIIEIFPMCEVQVEEEAT